MIHYYLLMYLKNFRNMCLKEYKLDPAHFLSAPGLAWQACLKKTKIKLELLTDLDMLLMIEKGIRGGITHAINRYAKANTKYMKDYDQRIKEPSYIQYLDPNNLHGWAISQKLPVDGFKWIDKSLIDKKFNRFVKLINNKIDKYEYLNGEEILPSNQQQMIEKAKFTYPPLGKAFEKQTKRIEDQGEKQIKAI